MVNHPPVRDQIIEFYADILKKETGFDYFHSQKIYHDLGNEPGVYPDVLFILYWLIKTYDIKKVVEMGSGFSTLFFQYLSQKMGFAFKSYEQNQKWLDVTHALLKAYGFNTLTAELMIDSNLEINCLTADLIFVDCNEREHYLTGMCSVLQNAKFVVIDDVNMFNHAITRFMRDTGREYFFIYDGGGRMDRIEFVSTKENISHEKLEEHLGYL